MFGTIATQIRMLDFNEHSREQLEIILGKHFPGKNELRISGFEEILGGWETTIISLRIDSQFVGAPTTDDLILRFYPGTNAAAQAQKEFAVMQFLYEFGIPVPRVDMLVIDNSPFGEPFIVMEKLLGHTLASELKAASENEILRWIQSSASLLVRLHKVPWQGLLPNEPAQDLTENGPLALTNSILASMRHSISRYHLIEFEPYMNWLEERVKQGASTEYCLMHNDYHPQNLMLSSKDHQLTILDWSFVEIGDFRLELAWSALLFGVMFGEQYRLPLMEFYEEITGRPIQHFKYFEVLKLTQRMLTIATWLDKSVTIPVPKITRDAIRGDYKIHVLNVYRRLKQILAYSLPTFENL